jgi:hypothetical protein
MLYRQGDVALRRIDSIPTDATPIPRHGGRHVLAYGEVTGHAHAIAAPDTDVEFLAGTDLEARFLRVLAEGGVSLIHEEHDTIVLPAGEYEVIRQREYDLASGTMRRVAD